MTTTATRYSIRKVEDGSGWEVVNGDNGSTMWAANREAARAIARKMNATPAVAVDEEGDAVPTAEDVELVDLAAVEADVAMEEAMDVDCPQGEVEAWDSGEQVDPEPAVEAPKVKPQRKPRTPKAPKAEATAEPTGEATVARKLERGQKIKLRGTGVVTVVGLVKVEKLKYLVEFEDAAGEYGSTEVWANARYRLIG